MQESEPICCLSLSIKAPAPHFSDKDSWGLKGLKYTGRTSSAHTDMSTTQWSRMRRNVDRHEIKNTISVELPLKKKKKNKQPVANV